MSPTAFSSAPWSLNLCSFSSSPPVSNDQEQGHVHFLQSSVRFSVILCVMAKISVSVDVKFKLNHFPKYNLGPDNQVFEENNEDFRGPTLVEVVEREIKQLNEQHNRLSVRDLASKFDQNLASAAKLSGKSKLKEVASFDGFLLLKKLRDALESLKGKLPRHGRDQVEKAIAMVEALAVKLTQKEGELIQEKVEVNRLVNFLKQASEDAKKLVNQEKSFACAEIESARAVVLRIREALQEQEQSQCSGKKRELEELVEEVQQARKIKLKHQPWKVADMENELREIRQLIKMKSITSMNLQNELVMSKASENNMSSVCELTGSVSLGSILRIQARPDAAIDLDKCLFQWFRLSSQCSRREPISGATKSVYAPEPIDVGRVLQVVISSNGTKFTLSTSEPIVQALDLENYLDTLGKTNGDFNVVISQMNDRNYSSNSTHLFHVGKTRIKLGRGWITKARDSYSKSMQLCGFRGGGNYATKSLFWLAQKGQSFVLVFDSQQYRNGALILARKYASIAMYS